MHGVTEGKLLEAIASHEKLLRMQLEDRRGFVTAWLYARGRGGKDGTRDARAEMRAQVIPTITALRAMRAYFCDCGRMRWGMSCSVCDRDD